MKRQGYFSYLWGLKRQFWFLLRLFILKTSGAVDFKVPFKVVSRKRKPADDVLFSELEPLYKYSQCSSAISTLEGIENKRRLLKHYP